MDKIYNSLTELVGNTPLLRLNNYKNANDLKANVIGKLEYFNPLGSVKDRVGLALIEDGEKKGLINKDTKIIEPTSGNTGIALAFVCATKGYNLTLTMPETMSVERRKLLTALGASIVLTPAEQGMKGAISKAKELSMENENSYIPGQFENFANPEIHKNTTALEIIEQTDGKIDIFVAGIGTGGTITGVGEVLKEKNKNIKIYAVEPLSSPFLSEAKAGPHKIQGIGAGFKPEILNTEIFDGIITVSNEDAFKTTNEIAKTEGLLVGISSGASLYAAKTLALLEENKDKNIVVILPDTGERYISTGVFD